MLKPTPLTLTAPVAYPYTWPLRMGIVYRPCTTDFLA